MLHTCDDLVKRVNEIGVMSFYGKFVEHFPRLEDETDPQSWNSDDLSRNPWYWKDRVCESRELAFGNLLGGSKGFLSRDMYGLFYAAYRPGEPLEALYADGKVSQLCKRAYDKIAEAGTISSVALKSALSLCEKGEGNQLSAALAFLQSTFFVSVTGGVQKLSKNDTPYGWPILQYTLAERWAEGWCGFDKPMPREQAAEAIIAHCAGLHDGIDLKRLRAKLFPKNLMI